MTCRWPWASWDAWLRSIRSYRYYHRSILSLTPLCIDSLQRAHCYFSQPHKYVSSLIISFTCCCSVSISSITFFSQVFATTQRQLSALPSRLSLSYEVSISRNFHLQTWTWSRRTGIVNFLMAIVKLLALAMGNLSNAFLIVLGSMSLWWLIFFKVSVQLERASRPSADLPRNAAINHLSHRSVLIASRSVLISDTISACHANITDL